jgi:hypothetical protein
MLHKQFNHHDFAHQHREVKWRSPEPIPDVDIGPWIDDRAHGWVVDGIKGFLVGIVVIEVRLDSVSPSEGKLMESGAYLEIDRINPYTGGTNHRDHRTDGVHIRWRQMMNLSASCI